MESNAMSIRSKIASFEAHNDEIRKAVPPSPKRAEDLLGSSSAAASVAGKFGSTSRGQQQESHEPMIEETPAPRVQRYQPLHQQYHQRRQQQQQEQQQQQQSGEGAPAVHQSPHRRAHHQRRLEKERRRQLEGSHRRSHNESRRDTYPEDSGPVAPEAGDGKYPTSTKVTTAQRLAKIQRMQRNRSIEKVRKNQQAPRMEYHEEERPPSPENLVQRDLSLQHSAADDDITLTSVRQIVGTSPEAKSPPNSPRGATYPDEMMYTDDRDWQEEEKSNKVMATAPVGIRMSTSSSSDEGGGDQVLHAITSQLTPDVASFFEESQRRYNPRGSREDDNASQGSESFAQRKERERLEKEAREAAVQKAKAEMDGPFIKADDMDYYQKHMDTPVAKTAAGVAVAATLGCVILGPVGLLVGAAAVGIGVGVLQIPTEQRQNMGEQASKALRQVSTAAMAASENFSASCANKYEESGLAEHVPDEVTTCCTAIRESPTTDKSEMSASAYEHNGQPSQAAAETSTLYETDRTVEENLPPKRLPPRRAGAACCREGSFTPVYLIYTLQPSDQPRAWMDVLASAETTYDEKLEALEEIMILAKDKSRARILVEEGILDALMWTLGRYFEKLYGQQAGQTWEHPEITPEEARSAKLSANCSLQLGKAYCAAMHTDGDLMLMSLYERGTVPEERQLAQLLYEVPYHARVTKTNDPTVVVPAEEGFALTQMTLGQAEEFARSVKALADGQAYQM